MTSFPSADPQPIPDNTFVPIPVETKPVISDPHANSPMSKPSPPPTPRTSTQTAIKRCLRPICGATKTNQWGTSPDGGQTLCQRCYVLYLSHKLPLFKHPVSGRLSIINFPQAVPVRVTGFALRQSPGKNSIRKPSRDAFKPFVVPLTDTPSDRALLRMTDHPGRSRPYRSRIRNRSIEKPKRKFQGQPGTRVEFAQAMRRKKLRTNRRESPILVLTDDDSSGSGYLVSDEDKSSASADTMTLSDQLEHSDVEVIATGAPMRDDDDDDANDGYISVPPKHPIHRELDRIHRPKSSVLRRSKPSTFIAKRDTSRMSVTERLFRKAMLRKISSHHDRQNQQESRLEDDTPLQQVSRNLPPPREMTIVPPRDSNAAACLGPTRPSEQKRTEDPHPNASLLFQERSAAAPLRESAAETGSTRPAPLRHGSHSLPFKNSLRPAAPPFPVISPVSENIDTLIGVKVEFRGDIRRLRIGVKSSFQSFASELCDLFELQGPLTIKYRDEENDFVTIANERDMKEMIYMVKEHRLVPLRVQLEERPVQNETSKEAGL